MTFMTFTEDEQPTLRPYQVKIVAEFERMVENGKRRVLLVAPTASGKTIIGAAIIKQFVRRQQSVLVLAHRREIIEQTSNKLKANGIKHGIIMASADDRLRPMERVQVASIQTLWVRAMRSDAMRLPPANLLVVDECHHAPAQTYQKIIEAYPDAVLLGLTATPCRGDGRGLGGVSRCESPSSRLLECSQCSAIRVGGQPCMVCGFLPKKPAQYVRVQDGELGVRSRDIAFAKSHAPRLTLSSSGQFNSNHLGPSWPTTNQ